MWGVRVVVRFLVKSIPWVFVRFLVKSIPWVFVRFLVKSIPWVFVRYLVKSIPWVGWPYPFQSLLFFSHLFSFFLICTLLLRSVCMILTFSLGIQSGIKKYG